MKKRKIVFSDIIEDEETEDVAEEEYAPANLRKRENDDGVDNETYIRHRNAERHRQFYQSARAFDESSDALVTDTSNASVPGGLSARGHNKRKKKNKRKSLLKLIAILAISALIFAGILIVGEKTMEHRYDSGPVAGRQEEVLHGTVVSVVGNDCEIKFDDEAESRDVRIPINSRIITSTGKSLNYQDIVANDRIAIVFKNNSNKVLRVYLE